MASSDFQLLSHSIGVLPTDCDQPLRHLILQMLQQIADIPGTKETPEEMAQLAGGIIMDGVRAL